MPVPLAAYWETILSQLETVIKLWLSNWPTAIPTVSTERPVALIDVLLLSLFYINESVYLLYSERSTSSLIHNISYCAFTATNIS